MAARARQLPEKTHVPAEELDTGVAAGSVLQPSDRDIVVRRDVEAVKPAAAGIENRTLAVGAYLVDENVPVIACKNEVVSVKADIRFAFACNGGILRERVHGRGRTGRDVVPLQLVPGVIVKDIRVRTRPAGLARGIYLAGEVLQEITRAVVQPKVAEVHEQDSGIVLIERRHRRVLAGYEGDARAEGIANPLDGSSEGVVRITAAHSRRLRSSRIFSNIWYFSRITPTRSWSTIQGYARLISCSSYLCASP